MPTGTLKKFIVDKAFGFIGPDDGSPDIFAPARTLDGDKMALREGMKVTFEAKLDDKSGKPMAATWKAIEDGLMAAGSYGAYGSTAAYGAFGTLPGMMATDRSSPYGGVTAAPSLLAVPGLPPGWDSAFDPKSGAVYYFNRATSETTWTKPV
mmetsp:Transcript_52397/g.81725  ORF Transcript_52397/g.81725 Transcript_52397/m.81725 type:complete len:152 (-) Transcript_52397:37-492(-)